MRVDSARRRIAALREEVFRAFIDPGHAGVLAAARGHERPPRAHRCASRRRLPDGADIRVGGGPRKVLDAHTDVTDTRIIALEPPERVVWSVEFPSDDPAFAGTMFMEWTLEARARGDRRHRATRPTSRRGSTRTTTPPGSPRHWHLAALFEGHSDAPRADRGVGRVRDRLGCGARRQVVVLEIARPVAQDPPELLEGVVGHHARVEVYFEHELHAVRLGRRRLPVSPASVSRRPASAAAQAGHLAEGVGGPAEQGELVR